MHRSIRIILMLFFLTAGKINAQQDTIGGVKDSTKLYKQIEEYSKKSKWKKFLYKLVFKPVSQNAKKIKALPAATKKPEVYSPYEGKIIRKINVYTLDPFGFSLLDTSIRPGGFIRKAGNSLHIKTQQITIKNLILIKKNEPFDSLKLKESERLIRSQRYVRDVRLTPAADGDSVDITIAVMDYWSITARFGASPSKVRLGVTDNNFGGMGHKLDNTYTWYHQTGEDAFSSSYNIPNIRNSFVGTDLYYKIDQFGNYEKGIAVNRPFYSPLARWASGVLYQQNFYTDSIAVTDSVYAQRSFRYNTTDLWMGSAFKLSRKRGVADRVTKLITAVRFLDITFKEMPPVELDTLKENASQDFYFGSIGLSRREYLQDQYVLNFGVKEDIPVGSAYSVVGGYQVKNNTGRIYAGINASRGNYYPFGYLNGTFQYGTFFRRGNPEQSVISLSFNYFTPILKLGRWHFRQFAKPQFITGINRYPSDEITLDNENGIKGFGSSQLLGTQKAVLTLQSRFYAPWSIIGFRFSPYLVYSCGVVGTEDSGFKNSRIYQVAGIGFLIKNDYLVLNTLEVSFAFYPVLYDEDSKYFRYNPIKSRNFRFQDFEIIKPGMVIYE